MAAEKKCDKSGRAELLRTRQAYPLAGKIVVSQQILRDFVTAVGGPEKCAVSFSGGKDSTVLLHMVRQIYPEIPGVFINTGLEYPEIVSYVKTFENIETVRPKMGFKEVVDTWGYPFPSKEQARYVSDIKNSRSQKMINLRMGKDGENRKPYSLSKKWYWLLNAKFNVSDKCCAVLKKRPVHKYQRESGRFPIVGTMAGESRLRLNSYLRNGCNVLEGKTIQSRPLMHWNESDVWAYAKLHDITFASVYYGENACSRTGCIFCMFGVDQEQKQTGTNRFLRLEKTHPKLHKYCIEKLGVGRVLHAAGIPFTTQLWED